MNADAQVLDDIQVERNVVAQAQTMLTSVIEHVATTKAALQAELQAFQAALQALYAKIADETNRANTAEQNSITDLSALNAALAAALATTQGHEQSALSGLKALDADLQTDIATLTSLDVDTVSLQNQTSNDLNTQVQAIQTDRQSLDQKVQTKADNDIQSSEDSMADLSQQMADQIEADLTVTQQQAVADFQVGLQERRSQVRAHLDQQADNVRAHADSTVQDTCKKDSARREGLTGELQALQQALETLVDAAQTTGKLVIEGTDDATRLIGTTNIGVRTVVDIFENLNQIFDEIREAW
jgi:hypothetical protein